MLLVVLCRVSLSVVKQNLKVFSPSTYRKWWIATPEYVTAFSASKSCRSDFGQIFTKAMLLLSSYANASCLEAAIVVNCCQEIFLAQCEFVASKTKALRIDCFTLCPSVAINLIKGLLRSTLGQRLTSSKLARNFALRKQRTPLSN